MVVEFGLADGELRCFVGSRPELCQHPRGTLVHGSRFAVVLHRKPVLSSVLIPPMFQTDIWAIALRPEHVQQELHLPRRRLADRNALRTAHRTPRRRRIRRSQHVERLWRVTLHRPHRGCAAHVEPVGRWVRPPGYVSFSIYICSNIDIGDVGWLDLIAYYTQWFKSGSAPSIDRDRIFLWARLYPAAADASDSVGRPDNWQWVRPSLILPPPHAHAPLPYSPNSSHHRHKTTSGPSYYSPRPQTSPSHAAPQHRRHRLRRE